MSQPHDEIMSKAREFANGLGVALVRLSKLRYAIVRVSVVPTGDRGEGHFMANLEAPVFGPCKFATSWEELMKMQQRHSAALAGAEAAQCLLDNPNIGIPNPAEDERGKQPQAHPSAAPTDGIALAHALNVLLDNERNG